MSARSILAAALVLTPLALSGSPTPAAAHEPDGILPALPKHAPPGVCYAHVRQSAEWSPPGPAHARWRLSPPPPGSPGPIWCLVTEPGAPPVKIREERFGWLRVLCDAEQTPERIGALQRRLHERGFYAGAYSGRYDAETVAGMRRFQASRHMEGAGYLSLGSLAALEGAQIEAGPVPPPPPVAAGPAFVPPPPPPVVTIAVPYHAPPPSPWLSWPGKSRW